MPADDLVLNVRQIAQYTPTENAPTNASLLMQLGIGGPYQSISPQDLVATALSTGGSMAIAGPLSVQSLQGGSAQFSNATLNVLSAQKACIVDLAATWGSIAGVKIATVDDVSNLNTAIRAASVWSFNGRVGDVRLWIDDIVCAGGAPLFSPRFEGSPRACTPPLDSNSSRLATTAFVHAAVQSADAGVISFNGRTGDVVLTALDVTSLVLPYAPIDSPNFTGYATSLTPPPGTVTGQIATCAFVMNAVTEATTGVSSFNTRTGAVVLQQADVVTVGAALLTSPIFTGTPTAPTAAPGTNTTQLATTAFVNTATGGGAYAPLNSPAFTGVPTAPTAATGTQTTQLATTAFVMAEINAVNAGVISFNGRTGDITLLANDISAAGGATLQSPVFTGTPTAPTPMPGTNTAQIATAAFVTAAIAALPIPPIASTTPPVMDGTATPGVSAAWSRGDHVHPTDTSRAAQASLANYLPLAGGSLTGQLNGTAASFNGAVNGAGTCTFGQIISSGAIYVGHNVQADMVILATALGGANGNNLSYQFYNGYNFTVNTGNGLLTYWANSNVAFTVAYTGLFTIPGTLSTPQISNVTLINPQGNNASTCGQPGNAWFQVASFNFPLESDARGKRNISVAPPGALDAVAEIPVHVFGYVSPNRRAPSRRIGWLAQEVLAVTPANVLVGEDEDQTLAVELGSMLATLWQAVQELTARLATLEAKAA
jgi:hypothetical protein